jgi:hypothetical protein
METSQPVTLPTQLTPGHQGSNTAWLHTRRAHRANGRTPIPVLRRPSHIWRMRSLRLVAGTPLGPKVHYCFHSVTRALKLLVRVDEEPG